MKLVFSG